MSTLKLNENSKQVNEFMFIVGATAWKSRKFYAKERERERDDVCVHISIVSVCAEKLSLNKSIEMAKSVTTKWIYIIGFKWSKKKPKNKK